MTMLPRLQIQPLRPRTIFDSFGQNTNPYQTINFDTPPDAPPPPSFGDLPPVDIGMDSGITPNYVTGTSAEYEPPGTTKPTVDERAIEEMRLRELYHPQTGASERFNRLLDEPPQMNEPGVGRKITAGLLGLGNVRRHIPGGVDVTEKVLHEPYYRGMADWKAKAEPFGQAANIERQGNIQERTLATDIIRNERENRRITETSRIADERNRINKIKATADRLKVEGWEFEVRGDRVIGYKRDGTPPKDFGPSGSMDESDKIELQSKGRIAAYEALGRSQANVANIREGEIYQQDSRTYRINSATGDKEDITGEAGPGILTRPGTPNAGGRAGTYADTQNEKLRKLYTERPEFREFIVPATTQGGSWQIADAPQPRAFGRGPDPVKARLYNELRRELGLPPLFNLPNQPARPNVSPPQGLGSRTVPAPTAQVDPFVQGQQQEAQDPFAQPPITAGQDFGRPQDALNKFRAGLRPQAQQQENPPEKIILLDQTTGQKFTLPWAEVEEFFKIPENTKRYKMVG